MYLYVEKNRFSNFYLECFFFIRLWKWPKSGLRQYWKNMKFSEIFHPGGGWEGGSYFEKLSKIIFYKLPKEHLHQVSWRPKNIQVWKNWGKNNRANWEKEAIRRLKPDFGHFQSLIRKKNIITRNTRCHVFLHADIY